jgi:CRP-like cAMP-binding protein
MNDVFRFIEDIWPVSQGLKSDLKNCLKRKEVKRNEILVMPGQVSKDIYFVSQGLLMKWHHNGAETITTGFSMEREICVSCAIFFDQVAAMEFVQAMENSVLFCLSYKRYSDLVGRYRELNHICRKVF